MVNTPPDNQELPVCVRACARVWFTNMKNIKTLIVPLQYLCQ
jgi:hypothetical protein